jgi:predicted RNA polymerase sigma factor
MAQRISRAKQTIKASGPALVPLPREQRAERMGSVLHVLYLIFNEGYTASFGPHLQRVELAREAIRLTRQLHRELPGDAEVVGLLALMLLTDARRPARSGPNGQLIPIAEQDRSLYDRDSILYGLLERIQPNLIVTLNHAVALAMANSARPALDLLDQLSGDDRFAAHHRYHAVKAHILELAGDHAAARASYELAAQRITSLPEQHYRRTRANRLAG